MKTLKKQDRIKGLYLYCNSHRKYYSDDSKKCKCENEVFVYRYKLHIPGSDNKCRIRTLSSTTIDDALIESRGIKRYFENNDFQKVKTIQDSCAPALLTECIDE